MCNRFELPSIYLKFANMITTQFSSKIKILCIDNAMEYKESSFTHFLSQNRTIVQRSCLGTSPQNRHAERKHKHILDTVDLFYSLHEPADSTSVIPSLSLSPPPPLHRTFHVSQPSVILQTMFPILIFSSMNLIHITRQVLTLFGRKQWQKKRMLSLVHILRIWLIYLLTSSWLVVNGSTK